MDSKFVKNDKIEYELKIELQKWCRPNTPQHVYCKENDVSTTILGIVIGDFYNKKKVEKFISSDNDSKYDISTMPISNHSVDYSLNSVSQKSNNLSNTRENKIKISTNIIVEKNESPAVQFVQNSYSSYTPLKMSDSGSKVKEEVHNNEIVIEKNSRFRINKINSHYQLIENHLAKIPHIPLNQIKGRDEARGWYTIGIIVGMSSRKKNDGEVYALIQLGNLKNTIINVFLFGKNLNKIKKSKIGQVLVICHAKTMVPQEKNSSIALNITSESEIYTLGNSQDLCFCKEKKSNGKPCNIPLDRRVSEICENHIISKYKEFRNKRQEFANGNFRFTMEQSNPSQLTKSTSGTYKFNNSTISTYNGHVKLNQFSKLDKKPHISEEDHKYLEKLKQNNSYGINLLKKVGIGSKLEESNKLLDKKREEKLLNIHPPEALLKMGIRAPIKKPIVNSNVSNFGNNKDKEKDIILDFDDDDDKITLNSTNNQKRTIEISLFNDKENEEEEKQHFKKFLEMKKKKRKIQLKDHS